MPLILFFLAIAVSVSACSPAPHGEPAPPLTPGKSRPAQAEVRGFSDTFVLVLTREYGRASFRECRLSVNQAMAVLSCTHGEAAGVVPPPMGIEEKLGTNEADGIRRLVGAADLYERGGTGVDWTSADGVFETLRVTNSAGQTIVLVTSGNPSFTDGARKQLLDALKEIEARLLNRVRRG